MSLFSTTAKIFENARISKVNRHQLDSKPVARIVHGSAQLFRTLDRTDPKQADISRRLWVFRSSVLFTLLLFSDENLALKRQLEELRRAAIGFPDSEPSVEMLEGAVEELLKTGRNPKREWLLERYGDKDPASAEEVGIFSRLSAGQTPGWPSDMSSDRLSLPKGMRIIWSRRDLRSSVFSTIVLPCACRNVGQALLEEVVYSGRSGVIEVLLYQGEQFYPPKRLRPPERDFLTGTNQFALKTLEVVDVKEESPATEVDSWVNEAFWQGVHGGARNADANLSAANYVLFCDGTGTFLPSNGRVPVLTENSPLSDESDLRLVDVEDLSEGDLLILRAGDSGFLLDVATDRIMHDDGSEFLLDDATEWKISLERALITSSCEDLAKALRARGVVTSALSIHHWAGPEVFGPGNEQVFKELMGLLSQMGKLPKSGQELTDYSNAGWLRLQELRRVRHRAGNVVRRELFEELFHRFEGGVGKLGDRECVHMQAGSGAELLILRVSSVDQSPAFVSPARLCRFDDLRGNKWLA